MPFTVVSLGGPVAAEGEAILRATGIVSLSTGPYPGKAESCCRSWPRRGLTR